MSTQSHGEVLAELKRLTDGFFHAVSFKTPEKPAYARLQELFIGGPDCSSRTAAQSRKSPRFANSLCLAKPQLTPGS